MSQKSPYGNGAMTLFIVERQHTDGLIIRFANDYSYAFCDAQAYQALEHFLDAFAGKNLNIVLSAESKDLLPAWREGKDIPVSFMAQPVLEAVTPCLSRESSLAAAAAFKRAQDRTLSRLAAQNFMRWHQLYGYDKRQAQHEKDEIKKFLTENGVDSANEDLQLLEEFYQREDLDNEKC